VLAKAIESFAEHGFAGASVRDIARRARIRVSSLYHYFPSKDALFQAVEERMQEELRDLTVSVMSQGLEMREMTREAVGRLFDFYRARPAYVRLGFRIHLDGEAARSYRRVVDRWLGLMDGLMKPAEQRGVIKAVDLPLFLLTVDGLVHWHLASHAFYRSVLGKTLDDPTTAARVREHLIEMVLRTVGLD
jgi:TetR/AcrR family transcriptional regulator